MKGKGSRQVKMASFKCNFLVHRIALEVLRTLIGYALEQRDDHDVEESRLALGYAQLAPVHEGRDRVTPLPLQVALAEHLRKMGLCALCSYLMRL